MSDLPDSTPPQSGDPIADLKQQIETETAQGKYSDEQLAELREIAEDHAHRVADSVAAHAEEVRDIRDGLREDAEAWKDDHADAIAAHHVEARDMADLAEPLDIAAIDVTGVALDTVLDDAAERVEAWRDIVEWRAEQGGETPEIVEAQLAQLDHAEEQIDAAHHAYDQQLDVDREHETTVMDDVRDANLPPNPTTIDAGDYHLAPGEHDLPTEA